MRSAYNKKNRVYYKRISKDADDFAQPYSFIDRHVATCSAVPPRFVIYETFDMQIFRKGKYLF